MLESQVVADFVFDMLSADATFMAAVGSRLYRDQIPQAAALPAAIVGPVVAAPDSNTLSGVRVHSTVTLDVHLVAAGSSYGPINVPAARADELIQGASGPNDGAYVVRLRRDDQRPYPESDGGSAYRHIVQTYRTEAHQTP